MAPRIWEVFARKSREDPLKHVGSLHADDATLAGVYAWKIYDEERWFEMVVAPRDAFVAVNRAEAPFTLAPPGADPAGSAGEGSGPRRTRKAPRRGRAR